MSDAVPPSDAGYDAALAEGSITFENNRSP